MDLYFYHSFPRPKTNQDSRKGFKILNSIIDFGLLLTVEKTEWKRPVGDHKQTPDWVKSQRACFTLLAPNELKLHSENFGEFSIEFDTQFLLEKLYAMPVIYIPNIIGSNINSKLSDLSRLLKRLITLKKECHENPSKQELYVTKTDDPTVNIPINVQTSNNILNYLEAENTSIEELNYYYLYLCSLICPTERLDKPDEILSYYQQREFRVTGISLSKNSDIIIEMPSDMLKAALLKIDYDFYSKIQNDGEHQARQVDFCRVLSKVDKRHILDFARRIIVPKDFLEETKSAVSKINLPEDRVVTFDD